MKTKHKVYILIQIFIAMFLLILFEVLFYNYKTSEYDKKLYSVVTDLSNDIKQDVYSNFGIIKAFARDLDSRNVKTKEDFNTLSSIYISQYPNISYLLHKNKDSVTDIVYPLKGNEYKLGKSLDGNIRELKLLENSLKFRDIIIGYPYDFKDLYDKSNIISIKYPYFKNNEFSGLIVLAIDTSRVIEKRISSSSFEKYSFKFYDSNMNEFFSNTNKENFNGHIESFKIEDIIWNVEISDNCDFQKSIILNMILYFIFFIILFTSFILLEIKIFNKNTYIEELKLLKEKIKHLAYYDNLTNLPNRHSIINILDKYISDSNKNRKKCAVLFMDLDNFKSINDTLGHSSGDQLLVKIVKTFDELTHDNFIASRIGGDEFVFLLLNIESIYEVSEACNKLLQLTKSTFSIQDKEINTTSSIGAAIYPEQGETVDELFKNADTAMYKAKLSGKNNYAIFNKSMSIELERRSNIDKFLNEAIENKELLVYYQPQLNLRDNKCYHMEALLRWNNKSLGWIPPSEFIPQAEETGIIRDIGEWTLLHVCKQLNLWDKQGYELRSVSVNISPVQLHDKHFVTKVKEILNSESMEISRITLEITEQVLIQDWDQCINTINELSKLGFSIALDDFGTGYSSLSYLANLPIDILKIDKLFIDNITSGDYDLALLKGIIELAHSINLTVIAEGIENENQLNILSKIGCDFIQGYYFSKPINENDICKFLDKFNNISDH